MSSLSTGTAEGVRTTDRGSQPCICPAVGTPQPQTENTPCGGTEGREPWTEKGVYMCHVLLAVFLLFQSKLDADAGV